MGQEISLGANIKKLREERGISQDQLARSIPISRPSVSSWEQGKGEPSVTNLIQIAKILNVSLDMLVGNAQESKSVVVLDTSVLMKRPIILEELVVKFDEVIIPDVVVSELNYQKDKAKRNNNRAWLAMANLEKKVASGEVKLKESAKKDGKNDERIFSVAIERAQAALADRVYMFSDDIDFAFFIRDNISNLEKLTFANYAEKFAQTTSYDQVKSQNFFSLIKAKKLDEAQSYYNRFQESVDINMPDPETGLTPLIQAVRNRHIKMVKYLIELKGIDFDMKDKQKYCFTPLLHAAQLKSEAFEIFKLMVENGADYERGSDGRNSGNTPLMVCAWGGFLEGVKYLLDFDQNICVNQQDSNGYTALIKACIKKNYDIAVLLVDRTDINIRSRENKRAEDYIDFKDKNAITLLTKLREKKNRSRL